MIYPPNCKKCGNIDINQFHLRDNGKRYVCSPCEKIKGKQYYERNKHKILIKSRKHGKEYYAKNREVILAKAKKKHTPKPLREYKFNYVKYFDEIKPQIFKLKPIFKLDSKNQILLFSFRCHNQNCKKDFICCYNQNYYCEDCFREKQTEYSNQKIQAKIINSLRRRLKDFIGRGKKYKGTQKCLRNEMVGCTHQELKRHLESQFKPGMSWENYGKWHIDHIKPISTFDLSILEQQKIANHYTNLQPLWATTAIARAHGDNESIGNLEKGNNYA